GGAGSLIGSYEPHRSDKPVDLPAVESGEEADGLQCVRSRAVNRRSRAIRRALHRALPRGHSSTSRYYAFVVAPRATGAPPRSVAPGSSVYSIGMLHARRYGPFPPSSTSGPWRRALDLSRERAHRV